MPSIMLVHPVKGKSSTSAKAVEVKCRIFQP
jgi:hypothetical protein